MPRTHRTAARPVLPGLPTPSLPADILRLIAQQLHHEDALRSLAHLARASKLTYSSAFPLLAQHVHIGSAGQLKMLIDKVDADPGRLLLARSLTLDFLPPKSHIPQLRRAVDALEREVILPNVHTVVITARALFSPAALLEGAGLQVVCRNDKWPNMDCPTLAKPTSLCVDFPIARAGQHSWFQKYEARVKRISLLSEGLQCLSIHNTPSEFWTIHFFHHHPFLVQSLRLSAARWGSQRTYCADVFFRRHFKKYTGRQFLQASAVGEEFNASSERVLQTVELVEDDASAQRSFEEFSSETINSLAATQQFEVSEEDGRKEIKGVEFTGPDVKQPCPACMTCHKVSHSTEH